MRSRIMCIVAGAMLVCGVGEARAQACTKEPDVRIGVVYVILNFPNGRAEGNEVGADFGQDSGGAPIRALMERDNQRWMFDFAAARPLLPDTMSLRELQARFKPHRTGWSFVAKREFDVQPLRQAGVERCAAYFAFDATAIWRVRVTAQPSDFVVAVTCPDRASCGPKTQTAFETNAMPTGTPIVLTLQLGICTYPVSLVPGDLAQQQLTIAPGLLASRCTGWQYFQYVVNRAGLKVPPNGIQISLVEQGPR